MIEELSGDLLQWLRGFYFLAEKGSLKGAAIAMGRVKATVSHQILCLEKELGVTLFDRSSGKMLITKEGMILRNEARALFDHVNQVMDTFKNEEETYQGKIQIAATPAILYYVLPPYVAHFRTSYPKVTFQLEGASRELVFRKVESTEVDLGITVSEVVHESFEWYDLCEASQVLIAPEKNPFFRTNRLPTLEEIARAPLILSANEGLREMVILERFAREGLRPNVVMTLNNFVGIKKYVADGMGVAILGRIAILPDDERALDIYNLDQYFPKRKYKIILKKRKYHSAFVRAFIRTIKPDIAFPDNEERSENEK